MNNKLFERADDWMNITWDEEKPVKSQIEEAGKSNLGKESLYVIFYRYDRGEAYEVYWAGKDLSQAKAEWKKNLLDFYAYGPDDVSQIWFVKFVNLSAAMVQGLLNYEKDEETAVTMLVKACLNGRTPDDFGWDPEGSPYVGEILAKHNGPDAADDLVNLGYDWDDLANMSDEDYRQAIIDNGLDESVIKESVEDDDFDDDVNTDRVAVVNYCSDDFEINSEMGVLEADAEYDVEDQEWLLQPGQTARDLENYLYNKVGVTNLDIYEVRPATPAEVKQLRAERAYF